MLQGPYNNLFLTTEPEKWQLNSLNLLRQLTDMNVNIKMKVI